VRRGRWWWAGAVAGPASGTRYLGLILGLSAGRLDVIDLATLPVVLALLAFRAVGPWRLGRQAWYLVAFAAMDFLGVLMSPMIG
jgi:hypothetical protein